MIQPDSLFSPKAVAKAIGVSESSLKRWCDSGKISAIKTAGGHRRITYADIIKFLRRQKIALQRPEVIGLPQLNMWQFQNNREWPPEKFQQALINGDKATSCDFLLGLFINHWPIERIIDDVVAPAFHQIGLDCASGTLQVYQERRACEAALSSLQKLRSILAAPPDGAPRAIGGSIEHDHCSLPTFAVELTLAANGWNARSLGSNLPFVTFLEAVNAEDPQLLWISISQIVDEGQLQQQLNQLASQLPPSITLVIGGQAITSPFRSGLKRVICCDNMSQLLASSNSLHFSRQFQTSKDSK